jgi:SAM-dependent methyltransferase
MVGEAASHLKPQFGERVQVTCADIAALPFVGAFDGVFSTATFHWVKDHERLFRSLYRVLKRGGWLVAQCGGGPNLARLRERVNALIVTPKYEPFFHGWEPPWNYAQPDITAARLRRAGFVEVETGTEEAAFSLPSAEQFREYLATVTLHQHIARIPDPSLREEFLDELARRSQQDPAFHLDYWRLNIQARRPD